MLFTGGIQDENICNLNINLTCEDNGEQLEIPSNLGINKFVLHCFKFNLYLRSIFI